MEQVFVFVFSLSVILPPVERFFVSLLAYSLEVFPFMFGVCFVLQYFFFYV